MAALVHRFRKWGKSLLLAAVLVTGTTVLLGVSEPFYPMKDWVLWHYLAIIGLAAYATTAAWSLGDWLLRTAFRLSLPSHERAALGMALGLAGFEVGMFLIGAIGGYGTFAFFAFPAALLLLGVTEWRNYHRRLNRLVRQGRNLTSSQVGYVLFGCLAFALIYFSILTPHNIQFDARWKHMALAEDYVAHGGLRRSPEGWVFSARPHLTSYLFAWAFSVPFGSLFHRMVLCAHLEFFVFAATTLFGIPALVRRLVPKADPRVVWAARFLFPGVLLYDSSLSGGADHFGALLAPAIALALFRAYRLLERRWVWLLTLLLASAAMVKETVAIMLVPLPVAVVALRALYLVSLPSAARRSVIQTYAVTLGTTLLLGLVATAPFWLTNVVWYGNPVYPSLGNVFPSRPWSSFADYRLNVEYSDMGAWAPSPDVYGLLESLRALVDFSFLPNDWSRFHGDRPLFGSLFTLLLPLTLWLKNTRRLWALIGWVHLAIFTWYWVHHQDRYLQTILPLMAACTASILVLSYRQFATHVRALIGILVAVQIAVGADTYFIATHAMTGSPVKKTVELLGMGYQGKYAERFVVEPKWVALASAIPKGERILFHDIHTHLGSEHEAVNDIALWQAGLNYSLAKDPAEIHRWIQEMGVRYIVANPLKSTGSDRLASDLIFQDFLRRRTLLVGEVEGVQIFKLPEKPIAASFRDRVIVVSCSPTPQFELYRLATLSQPGIGPDSKPRRRPEKTTTDITMLREWYNEADFAVLGTKCEPPSGFSGQFRKTVERAKRGNIPPGFLYIRRDKGVDSDE